VLQGSFVLFSLNIFASSSERTLKSVICSGNVSVTKSLIGILFFHGDSGYTKNSFFFMEAAVPSGIRTLLYTIKST
jgi:hypothetical protein